MKLYEIIDFDENECKITVRYGSFPYISIDIPINDNGMLMTGKELETYITGMLPTYYVDRMKRIAKGVKNVGDIKNLINKNELKNDVLLSDNPEEQQRQLDVINYLESL